METKDYSNYMDEELPIPEKNFILKGIAIGCIITLVLLILTVTIGLLIFLL